MNTLKGTICSFALVATFGSAACMAQQGPQLGNHGPELGNGLPVPPVTQVKRCEALAHFVKEVAAARDAGESERHFVGRHGLNMRPPEGLGLIHRRLDTNSRAPQESLGLVHQVFASADSPAVWQQKANGSCDRSLTQI